jgi:hypothetical protein
MSVELDDSPITYPADEKTGALAHVRIKGGALGWMTGVEVNGIGIPCTELTYQVSARGEPILTLTFPAVVEIDATMKTGQIVLKQDALKKTTDRPAA